MNGSLQLNLQTIAHIGSALLLLIGMGIKSAQVDDPETLKEWSSTANWAAISGAMIAVGSAMHNRGITKTAQKAPPVDDHGKSSAVLTVTKAVEQAASTGEIPLAKRLLCAIEEPEGKP